MWGGGHRCIVITERDLECLKNRPTYLTMFSYPHVKEHTSFETTSCCILFGLPQEVLLIWKAENCPNYSTFDDFALLSPKIQQALYRKIPG